jgi:hypothetical protein
MHGILRLRDKITQGHKQPGWRERYDAFGTEEVIHEETPPGGATATDQAAINVFHHGDTAGA